ncbi:MAG: HAMP domain-containing histidine kinase, partial [Campylobacterales bacterium]
EMIDRLSLSLKLENHTIELKTSAFEIEPLVQEVCSMLQQKYQGRVIIILGEGCSVVADRTLIYLVLVNLIDNALKYSKDEVYVSMSVEDRHCRVTVRDQGVGIEEREIKNITKKFYRVDRYSWDNSLGIGLSMVDYVLRLHGSVLSIKSTIGKGSEFSFTLELATPPTSLGATPEKS